MRRYQYGYPTTNILLDRGAMNRLTFPVKLSPALAQAILIKAQDIYDEGVKTLDALATDLAAEEAVRTNERTMSSLTGADLEEALAYLAAKDLVRKYESKYSVGKTDPKLPYDCTDLDKITICAQETWEATNAQCILDNARKEAVTLAIRAQFDALDQVALDMRTRTIAAIKVSLPADITANLGAI